MEGTQLFDLMGKLQLYGMKAAFDQIMATAVKPARAGAYSRRPAQGRDQ
jgi:hypothetical protein